MRAGSLSALGRLVMVSLGVLIATPALPCSPSPLGPARPLTAAQIDRAARTYLGSAGAVIEARLVRPPRHRRLNERVPPPPGMLRVERVLYGTAKTLVVIPMADPCLVNFQKVGERGVVVLASDGSPIGNFVDGPVATRIRTILKRRNSARGRDR